MPKNCPNCGLLNPDEAAQCECGNILHLDPESATKTPVRHTGDVVRKSMLPQTWLLRGILLGIVIGPILGLLFRRGDHWADRALGGLVAGFVLGVFCGLSGWWLHH